MTPSIPGNAGVRKYRNEPVVVDGLRFASKAEARRYGELKLLAKAGEVRDLRTQPRYDLVVNGRKVCTYIADFGYRDRTGMPVTEDVKSEATRKLPAFRIKAKLFRALMGREIVVVEQS